MTKYDCSSADINPIGSIDKADLKRFVTWAGKEFDIPCLSEFVHATPTAELEPFSDDYVQSDEADMGMSYAELTAFGKGTHSCCQFSEISNKIRAPPQGEEYGSSVNVAAPRSCLGEGPKQRTR